MRHTLFVIEVNINMLLWWTKSFWWFLCNWWSLNSYLYFFFNFFPDFYQFVKNFAQFYLFWCLLECCAININKWTPFESTMRPCMHVINLYLITTFHSAVIGIKGAWVIPNDSTFSWKSFTYAYNHNSLGELWNILQLLCSWPEARSMLWKWSPAL